jgi:1-deoxy-D-xylulose-5-phosphate synthase
MLDLFVQKHCRLWITLEDNVIEGGFGSSINEYAMGYEEEIRVLNMGIPDRFIEHGSVKELKKELGLDPAGIAVKIISLLGKENAYAGLPKRTH